MSAFTKRILGAVVAVGLVATVASAGGLLQGAKVAPQSKVSQANCACEGCCDDGSCCCETGVCNCADCTCECCASGANACCVAGACSQAAAVAPVSKAACGGCCKSSQ